MSSHAIQPAEPVEHTDILVPIDTDKELITWDGNDAHIDGMNFCTLIFCSRQLDSAWKGVFEKNIHPEMIFSRLEREVLIIGLWH